jgi:predicted nuclease of predicted toxin-antitoxin system
MRFLVDANLSPQLVSPLRQSGHDVVHVTDIDKLAASDTEILQMAETDQRVVITADTDFPMMLALRRPPAPRWCCCGVCRS